MEEISATHRPDRQPPTSASGWRLRSLYDHLYPIIRMYHVLTRALHRTLLSTVAHDCLNIAQSTAYSAIVALFPALIVAAATIGLIPDTAPVRFQLSAFFSRILPPGVGALLDVAFQNSPRHMHSLRALVSAIFVSLAGASNVIATLMEGFRRARELPENWTFWGRRLRALQLVPLSLAPLFLASVLVVFGHAAAGWLVSNLGPEVRNPIYTITMWIRWVLALGTSVGVISLLYQLGVADHPSTPADPAEGGRTRRRFLGMRPAISFVPPWLHVSKSWRATLPGAVMATLMWFVTTLAFGWYVTRFTNYSEVYGSLAAGIALLFWLYIISLSVLCGAEFNAQFAIQQQATVRQPERPIGPPFPVSEGEDNAAQPGVSLRDSDQR